MFESANRPPGNGMLTACSESAFANFASPGKGTGVSGGLASAKYAVRRARASFSSRPKSAQRLICAIATGAAQSSTNTGSMKFGRLLAAAHCAERRSQPE